MKAILEIGGKQVVVEPGARIRTELFVDKNVGDQFEIDSVLCVFGDGKALVGTPHVKGAKVKVTITKADRGPKIEMRTYKPRSQRRRTKGHRQEFHEIKIEEVIAG